MENTDRYLEAARIVAECKPSKLPYVLAILKEGGIEIEDAPKLTSPENLKGNEKRKRRMSEARGGADPKEWYDTEDETVIALRNAFKGGMNISEFAAVSGLPRTATYKIMSAKTPLTEYYRAKVEKGLGIINKTE